MTCWVSALGSRAALCALAGLTLLAFDRPPAAQGPDLFATSMSQPINVTFLVRAKGPAPVDPDTGAPFILGVGGNDVVL